MIGTTTAGRVALAVTSALFLAGAVAAVQVHEQEGAARDSAEHLEQHVSRLEREIEDALANDERDRARELLAAELDAGIVAEIAGVDASEALPLLARLDELATSLFATVHVLRIREEFVRFLSTDPEANGEALFAARAEVARARYHAGDYDGALLIQEELHEARELRGSRRRRLRLKVELAATRSQLGDLGGAEELAREVLEASESEPIELDDRLAAKRILAVVHARNGDIPAADALFEEIHASLEAAGAEGIALLDAKLDLSTTREQMGDLEGALALQEIVLAGFEDAFPPDHPDMLRVLGNLAITRASHGDLEGALPLFERIVRVRSDSLPADHPDVLRAKENYAITAYQLGYLEVAHRLLSGTLAIHEARLPPEHPVLVTAKANVAALRLDLGDLEGARILLEDVLAYRSRRYPVDHPLVLGAKQNLAGTLVDLGEVEVAASLFTEVLEARERSLAPGHPALVEATLNLASAMAALGRLEEALGLGGLALEACEGGLSETHPVAIAAKLSLAVTYARTGDHERALALEEEVLEARSTILQPTHPDRLEVECAVAIARARAGDVEGSLEMARTCLQHVRERLEALAIEPPRVSRSSGRMELRRLQELVWLSGELEGGAVLVAEILIALEELRDVPTASVELDQAVRDDPELKSLREEVQRHRKGLAALIQSPPEDGTELPTWRSWIVAASEARDRAQRALRARQSELGSVWERTSVEDLKDALGANDVLISYLRVRWGQRGGDELLAFVVSPEGSLRRCDLGSAEELEQLAVSWRASLGRALDEARGASARGVGEETGETASEAMSAHGRRLHARLIEPCLAAAGVRGAARIFVVPDDFLHLLPLDALPVSEGTALGDVSQVVLEPSACRLVTFRTGADEGVLVGLGDVDYDSSSGIFSAPVVASTRGVVFGRLEETGREVAAVAASYEAATGMRPVILSSARASKSALMEHVGAARYLHIATHGWFAPDAAASVREEGSPGPGDSALTRMNEEVRGLAPDALSGLALAGANLGLDSAGTAPGILTAEELATLDLSRCELAVLSACETNVGIRRAGQGIQSLQTALHAAGVRTAITSLWKVDDAATRRLMEVFYAKLWKDGLGKADALWQAKATLRGEGQPLRNWAGWVLTGNPD